MNLNFLAGRKFQKYIPQEDAFQKGLYMFDIGQNDLAGAFYSKSLDQILASIPTILVEFETGIKVRIRSLIKHFKFSRTLLLSKPIMTPILFSHFQGLYDQGARNFWIHNTGPLGCLTQNIAKFGTDPSKLDELGCVSGHNQAARIFNLQLYALCKKLQGQYSDANVIHVDIYTIKHNLIANYSRYGLCSSPL